MNNTAYIGTFEQIAAVLFPPKYDMHVHAWRRFRRAKIMRELPAVLNDDVAFQFLRGVER